MLAQRCKLFMVVDNNTNKLQQLIAKSLKHLFENSNYYICTHINARKVHRADQKRTSSYMCLDQPYTDKHQLTSHGTQ